MAVKIEFTGFINGVRQFDWGHAYDVAHSQMMKDEQDEWKVVGKDYFSVTGKPGFEEGDQVAVVGTLKTKLFDKKDGSKGVALNVRATEMTKVERRSKDAPKIGHAAVHEVFGTGKPIEESAPF